MLSKIKLEKFTKNDFPYYFQLVNNECVMAMITERPIPLDEARSDFNKLLINNELDPNFGNFKIVDIESDQFIGLAKLEIKEINRSEAELGYMILPKYWGKGIGSRIGKQLIEKAKMQPSIRKIVAIIDPKNLPSKKILTNNNFISITFKNFDGLPGEILELELKK